MPPYALLPDQTGLLRRLKVVSPSTIPSLVLAVLHSSSPVIPPDRTAEPLPTTTTITATITHAHARARTRGYKCALAQTEQESRTQTLHPPGNASGYEIRTSA